MIQRKKHLFFDMDDTITLTRSQMEDKLYAFYKTLPYNLIVVSGANVAQIRKQIRDLPFFTLGQNGNQALDPHGNILWEDILHESHVADIHEHILKIKEICHIIPPKADDLVEHRGAQISYSIIGHNQPVELKKVCDPLREIRLSLLEKVPFDHPELEVKIGGTTCFDYFKKGSHKGANVRRLLAEMEWDPADAIYFGDALFPGGNDESVIGVIDTHPVTDHLDTFRILTESLMGKTSLQK